MRSLDWKESVHWVPNTFDVDVDIGFVVVFDVVSCLYILSSSFFDLFFFFFRLPPIFFSLALISFMVLLCGHLTHSSLVSFWLLQRLCVVEHCMLQWVALDRRFEGLDTTGLLSILRDIELLFFRRMRVMLT